MTVREQGHSSRFRACCASFSSHWELSELSFISVLGQADQPGLVKEEEEQAAAGGCWPPWAAGNQLSIISELKRTSRNTLDNPCCAVVQRVLSTLFTLCVVTATTQLFPSNCEKS